ncbi:hydrolase [Aestuariibaculum lutulentum]|uniref:Hydrolase n=1 Tax=Aestuariibaculum lutulentum TaxID=2920935 RepID=A0ABS9RLK4_9FLAO|nr:hydrolase [Aestuariibaculum lutulentum]MCH4553835.1 hydrolase [Aestuariibaculum lutulentum]
MKQRIFMYLFVFAMLLVLFQFVNSKRVFEDMNKNIGDYKEQLQQYKDSLVTMQHEIADLLHFNLNRNEDAISYFENQGYNTSELIPIIKDELYKLNEVKGEHPIVPYAPSEGKRMMINTIKLLNHKWIIADFTDGKYWGEMFLTYYINQDQQIEFNIVESFLYPFD